MTLNGVVAIILRYFSEIGSMGWKCLYGQLAFLVL